MKKILLSFLLFTILIVSYLIPTSTVYAQVAHCGNISANQTWSSGNNVHVVTCNVTVAAGVTLTITQGAIVKFNPGTALIVQGTLRVTGTATNPVYLTSARDDTVGGDTNGDGATTPAPGDWSRIEFQDGSNDAASLIEYAQIRYGGNCCYHGAVTLVNASPTVRNTTITRSEYYGILASSSLPTLVCNDIYGNARIGIQNNTPASIVKAENHWWGHASGPTHPSNPGGAGQSVSNGVDFTPWARKSCILPVRIEAGGTARYTDTSNNVWRPDTGFIGGNTIDRGAIPIANTTNDRIYQTERYGMTGYSFTVPNGNYTVKLHFAETHSPITGPGQRVFSVKVQNTTIQNLDVYAEAGGRNIALVKTIPVTVTNGQLRITFTKQVQNPMINGIEVIPQP